MQSAVLIQSVEGAGEEVDLYGQTACNCDDFGITDTLPEILGIQRGASKAEIKKAYHKVCDFTLARQSTAKKR